MPAQSPLGAPFEAFAQCGDRLLLIGGNAVISYGGQRLTQDCDCAVVAADEALLADALKPLSYWLQLRTALFARYTHIGARRPVVDVMFFDVDTFEGLRSESRQVQIVEGITLRVPKPLHLVALKLHALNQQPSRIGKDWDDIVFLLDTFRDEWTREQLRELAASYASADTIRLLEQARFL